MSKNIPSMMIYIGVVCEKTSLHKQPDLGVVVVKVRRPEVDGRSTFVSLKCELA